MAFSNISMNKQTTLKVSKETHNLVLQAKKKLKKVFSSFTLDVNVDNDFVVKQGAKEILTKDTETLIEGAVNWKQKK